MEKKKKKKKKRKGKMSDKLKELFSKPFSCFLSYLPSLLSIWINPDKGVLKLL